jgi:hypothetical protein
VALIALCADKGSPGVTTTAVALAATWPVPAGVVEADPSGGDLALHLTDGRGRFVLADQPNLLTFAAAARRGPAVELTWQHCQTTTGGLRVLRGLASAEQAGGLERLWPCVADALAATGRAGGGDVLADLGRLLPGSPALQVAACADLVVLVAASSTPGLVQLRERAHGLAPVAARLAAVLVASDRHGHDAVRAARDVLDRDGLPVQVAGFVAVDRRAVAALHRGERSGRLGLSMLARSAGRVGSQLAAHVRAPAPAAATPTGVTGLGHGGGRR